MPARPRGPHSPPPAEKKNVRFTPAAQRETFTNDRGGFTMPVWGWVLIAVGAAILIAVVGLITVARRRSSHLRSRFGPEYDRMLGRSGSKREAESELAERERRRAARRRPRRCARRCSTTAS